MGANLDEHRPMEQIEQLVRRLQALPQSDARTIALELLHCVMDFHGAALERMVELLPQTTDPHYALETLASDPLVGTLLLLYGIHPLSLETRVGRALERVRPYLQGRGVEIQLLGIVEGTVRVALQGANGCGAGVAREAVENAIQEVAPDVVSVEIEGVDAAPAAQGFVPLAQLQRVPATQHAKTAAD